MVYRDFRLCVSCGSVMVLKEENGDKKVYVCLECGVEHVVFKL